MSSLERFIRLDYPVLLPAIARCPVPLAYRLADLRGRIYCRLKSESCRFARENLSAAFPRLKDEQIKRLVTEHFEVRSRDEMEAFWYQKPAPFFDSFVGVSGQEILDDAAGKSAGVLLFSGHFGSVGLFFVVMGKRGVRMNIVGRSLEPGENPMPEAVTEYNRRKVAWIEEAVGCPFVLTGKGNYPVLCEKLRQGEVVMLLIDVVPFLLKRTVPVTFMSRPAAFGDGMASLFRETGARIVQWSIHREVASGHQEIEITDLSSRVSAALTNAEIMQVMVTALEGKILGNPGHWHAWDSLEHFFIQR